MKLLTIVLFVCSLSLTYIQSKAIDFNLLFRNEVKGFHFHSYFFQENTKSTGEATTFRKKILDHVGQNYLYDCIVSEMYNEPHGPHIVGNFITCCNSTAMWRALPWFMQNHGNLSVLLHALTRNVIADHIERAMWLGNLIPLDFTRYNLPSNGTEFRCVPEDWP